MARQGIFSKSSKELKEDRDKGDSGSDSEHKSFHLTPVLVLMAVSGCYSIREGIVTNILLWIYKFFYVLLVVSMTSKYVYQFHLSPLAHLATMVLCAQCVGDFLCCWKMFSSRFGHFFDSVSRVESVTDTMRRKGITIDMSYFNKRKLITNILFILLQSVCVIIQFISMYVLNESPQEYTNAITDPLPDTYLSRFLIVFPICLMLITLITPVPFCMVICYMLNSVMNAFNQYLNAIVEQKDTQFLCGLGEMRELHLEICTIVSRFDKDFKYLFANMYMWTISIAILVLYQFFKADLTIFTGFIYLYFVTLSLFLLVCISVSAAKVHDKAHSPLEMLYHIRIDGVNIEQAVQIQLFLSKLTGTSVGFTICGLLTITKEFILTVAGAFLTYFAVLYTL